MRGATCRCLVVKEETYDVQFFWCSKMNRKSAIEQALDFSTKQSTFSYEDTADRCYRDIIDAIEGFGWKRVPHKKKTKVEKKR